MGTEQGDTNEDELVSHVRSLSQDELRTAVAHLWQKRGYTIHDRNSDWLSVTRDEEAGVVLVAAPDRNVDVRSAIKSASDPVTVVTPYGVDSKVQSWIKRSDRATLLDATDLVRIAREEDVVSDVFDRPATEAGAQQSDLGVPASLGIALVPAIGATWALWSIGYLATYSHGNLPSLAELPGFLAALLCFGLFYGMLSAELKHDGNLFGKLAVGIGIVATLVYAVGRLVFALPMDSPQTLVTFGGAAYVLVALPLAFPVWTGMIAGGTAGLVHRAIK